MLRIFKAPEAFSFGLEDRFNAKMQWHLNNSGVPCIVRDIWSDFWARRLYFSPLPYSYRIYLSSVAPLYCWMNLHKIRENDVVWVNGPSLPITDTECRFEKEVIHRGASYIFWLEDDYFSNPAQKLTAEVRMQLTDLVVAVTPALKDRISQLYPDKKVICLEEPIDVERLKPRESYAHNSKPLVVWSGRPWNLKKLLLLDAVLKRVYQEIPFTLRIVTGAEKPEMTLSIPWEWVPYDPLKEAEYAAGAIAALAPLEDTLYNKCKGNYKVKTYMALGVPPLTSPVGYNYQLIRHGETGFLLDSEEEWQKVLRALLKDPSLAEKIGVAARSHIIGRYSYEALMPVWAEALRKFFPGKLCPKNPI